MIVVTESHYKAWFPLNRNRIMKSCNSGRFYFRQINHDLKQKSDRNRFRRKEFGIFARWAMVDQAREGLCYQ